MKENFKKFLEAKGINEEMFGKKSAEEMAGLYNEYNEKNYTELNKLIESKATSEAIENLRSEIKTAQAEQMKSLNENLKQMGLAIKKLNETEKATTVRPFEQIRKGLEANIDKLKALKNGEMNEAKANEFSFKAAGTMLESTNISGGNVPVEQRIAGLNTIASRRVKLLDVISKGTASSNIISWVYQANKDGAAGGTSEGATKNQIDFDLVVASQAVVKRTAYIKVSTEMLDDIDFINTEINNELMRELMKDVESQAYSGNGSAPNLNGIKTVATAFAAGTFAGTVDNANEVDVIRVAMNQIKLAEHDAPNYIFMNPSDVTKLKLIKVTSTDKRYIDQLQVIAGQLSIDGIPVIESTLIPVTEYLVGSFDMATLYEKGQIGISIGLDGNDFTKNLRTIIAEWRGALVVKNNDRTAFVKGDFDTDKASLETP